MARVAANGRCKFHGGHSTGPRTQEGRDRIARAQRERWRLWKAANPKLFPDVSNRQEQRIKKAYRIERHKQRLRSETEAWLIDRYGEDWQAGMLRVQEELQRRREARKPLTPEQNAIADEFLDSWQARASRSETQDWIEHLRQIEGTKAAPPTTRPDNTGEEQAPPDLSPVITRAEADIAHKLQAQIARQPSHRIKRLDYAERQERTQAQAQELIERHGLDRRRPTVRVGYAGKKRR